MLLIKSSGEKEKQAESEITNFNTEQTRKQQIPCRLRDDQMLHINVGINHQATIQT